MENEMDPIDAMQERINIAIMNHTANILIGNDWWEISRFYIDQAGNFCFMFNDGMKDGTAGFVIKHKSL